MDTVSNNIGFNIKQLSLENLTKEALLLQYSDKLRSKEYASIASQKAREEVNFVVEAKMLNLLGYHAFSETNYKAANTYLGQAIILAKKIKNSELLAYALNYLGNVYLAQNDYKSAISHYFDALKEISSGKIYALIHMNLGTVYRSLRDYESAIKYYLEAQELNERDSNDKRLRALLTANIGALYFELGHYDKALNYIKIGTATLEELGDKNGTAISYLFYTKYHFSIENYAEALNASIESYRLSEEVGNKYVMCRALNHIGKARLQLNDKKQGIACLEQALVLSKECSLDEVSADVLFQLGELGDEDNVFEVAKRYFEQAIIHYHRALNFEAVELCYNKLSYLYEQIGSYKLALEYARKKFELVEDKSREFKESYTTKIDIQFLLKEKEQEIYNLEEQNKLQAELISKTKQITTQNEQLQQVNQELKRFAYVVSHDFKEPLRMINAYTGLLKRDLLPVLDESTVDYMDFITDGAKRMQGLIDSLLQYSSIDKKVFEEQEVDLNDVLFEVEMNLKMKFEETDARLNAGNLPVIRSHHHLILQLFQNLMSNAIKFRKKDTIPTVNITIDNDTEGKVIKIEDNGIGIEKDNISRVFEMFFRPHKRTDYEGTGIGLAICYKVMQTLGGKIWVESEYGKGTTFYLFFPDDVIFEEEQLEN